MYNIVENSYLVHMHWMCFPCAPIPYMQATIMKTLHLYNYTEYVLTHSVIINLYAFATIGKKRYFALDFGIPWIEGSASIYMYVYRYVVWLYLQMYWKSTIVHLAARCITVVIVVYTKKNSCGLYSPQLKYTC